MKPLLIFLAFLSAALAAALSLVHQHARLVQIAYDQNRLETEFQQVSTRLETLKVKRAELIVPNRLERFAGRPGYLSAEAGQRIILERR